MFKASRTSLLVTAMLGAGCGGGGGGGDAPPPPPNADLSGVWAGAWQGSDPINGTVSGSWEVTITQAQSTASGPSLLLGDIDCMDGAMQSTVSSGQSTFNGSVSRAPCGSIQWTLTAVNTTTGDAAGNWQNSQTSGTGSLRGKRIAKLGQPRIRSVWPPAGPPGTLVTVSGDLLTGVTELSFNKVAQSTFTANGTRVVARVPPAASTGAVQVSVGAAVATSPRAFSVDVQSPPAVKGNSVLRGVEPAASAVSPDGRKVYVADRDATSGAVTVLRTVGLVTTVNQLLPGMRPRSLAPSPDGRRVYVAAPGAGVLVMDAANLQVKQTIPLVLDDEGRDNPQGIAVSPDGALVAVSTGTAGGGVHVIRTTDGADLGDFVPGPTLAPLGVAFDPAGAAVYVAAAEVGGAAGSLITFNPVTRTEIRRIAVDIRPTGIAVTPDAQIVFVANQGSDTVTRYDPASGLPLSTTPAGAEPTALAVSPDGTQVYVTNRSSGSVSVLLAASGNVSATVPSMGTTPIGIAMHPLGSFAYVAAAGSHTLAEVGRMRTLTVVTSGTGIGRVTSSPSGVDCGTACQMQFGNGTLVSLTSVPDATSHFAGWSGAGCGSIVTLTADLTCRAQFDSNAPPPNPQNPPRGGDGGGCFIATAAYGSDMAPEVQALREFRDRRLLTNPPGRAFVAFYYRHSPALADAIRPHDGVRAAVRATLRPLVWTVQHPAPAALLSLLAVAAFALRKRRATRQLLNQTVSQKPSWLVRLTSCHFGK
jgi:YVTN family beta-propeller protein